jgi:hypothetical protein
MSKPRMKTRVTATATDAALPRIEPASISRVDVARRAYEIYRARGYDHGHDLDDWLQAERELTRRRHQDHVAIEA